MQKLFLPLAMLLCGLPAFSQNPQLLKDINPGANGSGIQQIVKTNGFTFFNAEDDDTDTDRGLYRTDGTPGGTIKLNLSYLPDPPPSPNNYASTKADKLMALGNKVIFSGDDFNYYGEIWSSDGTQAGTIALERYQPSITSNRPVISDIAALNSEALYSVRNTDNHLLLKKTNGTAGSVTTVYDFGVAPNGDAQVTLFKVVNNILYFVYYNGGNIDQLWRSDGTTAGTYLVKDFTSARYVASNIMPAGSNFYIMMVEPGVGNVLWKSDGTAAGTSALKTIGTSGNNNYPQHVAIGSTLYFSGLDVNGMELWKTDGTINGTARISDLNPGAGSSNPTSLTVLNNAVFFSADNGTTGRELYRSPGTFISLVRDILPGTASSNVNNIVVSNNTLLFSASNGVNGTELWISDGSFANTRQVADINPGGNANPSMLTTGSEVYFTADNGSSGMEIFKYNNAGGITTGATFETIYVNDSSTFGDVLTTGTGNNANPGTPEAPVANISHALSIAQPGFTIVVDAGTYTEQLNIEKAITIRGAGRTLTFLNGPAAPITALPDFAEKGIIQSLAGTGDVIIDRISIDGSQSDEVHAVLIQGGGSVINCEIKNANNGIFFRYSDVAAIRSANASNNLIYGVAYVGINYAGTKLNSFAFSNTINLAGATFGMAIIGGFDFGALPLFSFQQNTVSNFNGWGVNANSVTGTVTNNSITGTAGFHLTGSGYAATCNWLGSADKSFVQSKVSGNILFSPWLTNGTDNLPTVEGFQPVAGVCTGSVGEFFVNDNVTAGDRFTTAIGNDANSGTAAFPFATLTKALNTAQSGDVVYIDAGTYPQTSTFQTLNKAVSLLGANYDINPNSAANLLIENSSRNAESIISGITYNIGTSNLIIKGFTIAPGPRSAMTLSNSAGTNNDFSNVELSNNRFVISSTTTLLPIIGKWVTSPSMPVTSGYTISNNRFLKTDAANTQAIQVSYLKNSSIDGNAFPAPPTFYTVLPINLGASGIVDNVSFSGNAIDKGWYNMFTQRVANAVIANNKFNSRLGMSFNNFVTESSNVTIKDNEFNETLPSAVVAYVTGGTKLPLTTTSISMTGNTFNFDATGNATSPGFLLGAFLDTTVVNSTVNLNNNKVNITGSFATSASTPTSAIRIGGRIFNSSISNNELTYTATGAISPPLPAVPNSGIFITTESNAQQGALPSNAVVNVSNNVINGFNTSVVLYDGGTTVDPYQGVGNLSNGAKVNINNNSFTNDFMSINNGEIGQSVNASCNWYGSALSSDITPKISALTVRNTPWLTVGGDQNVAIGFQPLSGACNGGQTKFYVNDNSLYGDVFTTAIGNNSNPGTSSAPLATIAYAILTAKAADTIIVDAGTYAERIFVNKPLAFIGAYSGINPNTSLSRGASESILLPSTENNLLEIITVQAGNVSFDGFLFDGNNPAITGSLLLNGIDVNAGMAIYNGNLQTDSLLIKNNIFKNFHRYGMLLQRTAQALTGIVITGNHIDNISSRLPRDGRAVGLFDNAYATVSDNHLTRVNTGVIIANFTTASADSIIIVGNKIEAYSVGVTSAGPVNLLRTLTISNNQIAVADLAAWSAPGSISINNSTGLNLGFVSSSNLLLATNTVTGTRTGIAVGQFTGTGKALLSDNVISGSETGMQLSSIKTPQPVRVTGGSISNSSQLGFFYIGNGTTTDNLKMQNVSLANNVVGMDVSAVGGTLQMELAGLIIDGGVTGIRFYGKELSLPGNALTGVSFSNQTKEYIYQTSKAFEGQTIDASAATFDGLTPMQMSLPQLFATEDKLTHRMDFDSVGYFKLKPKEVFLTANSFAATLPPVFGTPTFAPSVIRAIDAAAAGDTVHVTAGNFAMTDTTIQKALTLRGPNSGVSPNDESNKALANASRNSEATISGATLSILTNDLAFEGFRFDPGNKSMFVLANTNLTNNDFGNFKIVKSLFNITHSALNLNTVNISGKFTSPASLPVSAGYTFSDNRFEKSGSASGTALNFNYAKNISLSGNSFVVTGTTVKTQTAANAGSAGQVESLVADNNYVEGYATLINANRLTLGSINHNTLINSDRGLNVSGTMAEPSTIEFRNNTMFNTTGGNGFIGYNKSGTASSTGTNLLRIEDNVITARPVLNLSPQFFGSINFSANNLAASPSYIIKGNKITYTGDFSQITNDFIRPITVRGNIANLNIEGNELTLINEVISLPPVLGSVLPPNPGITINTDFGPNSFMPNNASINVVNNKLQGFKQSVVFYDPANGRDTYVGYGNIPFGATVNIQNNSFTADSISVNAGEVGEVVNANCNWYGTTNPELILNKTTPTVNFSPWLSDGADSDATTSGFQPTPGACNGTYLGITLVGSTDVTCNGGSNGSIDLTITGGTAPITIAWTQDEDASFSASTADLTNLKAGTYNLNVSDVFGATASLKVTVYQPEVLTATGDGTNNLCAGAAEGTATVLVKGGTDPYTFLWSNGAITESLNNLIAGNYTVTITDANGCTTTAGYTVTQPTQLTALATGTSTACANAASVAVSGGIAPYSYLWSNGATTAGVNNIAAGAYSVTVTDANGCTKVANVTVTGGEAFNPSVQVTDVSCAGGTNGILTVTNANGQSPFRYSIDGINFQTSNVFNNLPAGPYTISVVDANNCAGFVTKVITAPPALVVTVNNIQATCGGFATGSITVTATGGSGGFTYNWVSTGYTATSRNINNLNAGTYNLAVTDNKGCIATASVLVTAFPAINVTPTVTNINCRGLNNGAIAQDVGGGTGGSFNYSWNNGAVTKDIANLVAGNYTVNITDITSGCVTTKNYTITQPLANVALTLTKTNATGCGGGTITAVGSGGTAGYEYRLNNGGYQASGNFTGLLAGNYTVWVKDAKGCTLSKIASITDNGSDQYESNNSKGQAKPIPIGTPVNARLALSNDAADWFSITTPPGTLSYTVTLSHPDFTYSFNLYAAGNNTPALVPASSGTGYKVYTLQGSTTYSIGISGGSLSYKCYTLSVTTPTFVKTNLVRNAKAVITEYPAPETLLATVFPNPHYGNFSMQIKSPKEGIARIQLFSLAGQKLAEKRIAVLKGENVVSFTGVQRGTIFYRVFVDMESTTGKIIGMQ